MNIIYSYVHLVRKDFNNRKLNIVLEETICIAMFSIMEKRQKKTDHFRPPLSNISRSAPAQHYDDSMVRRWCRQFTEGLTNVHDEDQSG